jgi:O-antigen biosynthesis protein
LATRMVHIRHFGYIQFHGADGGNTQRVRNAEIQRLVSYFRTHYGARIHQRLVDLGVDDFIWRDGVLDWNAEPDGHRPLDANLAFDP